MMEGTSGRWRASSCSKEGGAQCYVCQAAGPRRGGGPAAVTMMTRRVDEGQLQEEAEEWVVETEASAAVWSSEWVPVRLQSQTSQGHRYLGCDRATGLLALSPTSQDEQQPQRWASFLLEVEDEDAGSFRLRQAKGRSPSDGFLAVAAVDGQGPPLLRCVEEQAVGADGVAWAVLRADRPLAALAPRLLRLAISPRSSDLQLRGRTLCSIAAWDGSPGGPSFRCTVQQPSVRGGDEEGDDVWLEQQSLLVFDRRRYLLPRVPLPEAGTVCTNEASVTGICTFAYGQGVTVGRSFTVNFNYLLFDTMTVNAAVTPSVSVVLRGPPLPQQGGGAGGNATATAVSPVTGQPLGGTQNTGGGVGGVAGGPVEAIAQSTTTAEATGGGGEESPPAAELVLLAAVTENLQNDLTVAYQNIYERATTKGYVETRNWQFTITSPPRSSASIEVWYQVLSLK